MAQLIFNLAVSAMFVCNAVIVLALIKADMMNDEEMARTHAMIDAQNVKLDKALARVEEIETWIDKTIIWEQNEAAKTRRNTNDIAKLKDQSIFVSSAPEPEEIGMCDEAGHDQD